MTRIQTRTRARILALLAPRVLSILVAGDTVLRHPADARGATRVPPPPLVVVVGVMTPAHPHRPSAVAAEGMTLGHLRLHLAVVAEGMTPGHLHLHLAVVGGTTLGHPHLHLAGVEGTIPFHLLPVEVQEDAVIAGLGLHRHRQKDTPVAVVGMIRGHLLPLLGGGMTMTPHHAAVPLVAGVVDPHPLLRVV